MWFDTKMQIIKKMKVEIRQSINLLQKIFLISPKFIHEIDTDLFVNFLYNVECLLCLLIGFPLNLKAPIKEL